MSLPEDCSMILSNAAAREGRPDFGPFVPNASYRVKQSFQADRDFFTGGEILIFRRSSISRYDAMAGYFFEDAAGQIKAWDLSDTDSTSIWVEFFEPLTPPS